MKFACKFVHGGQCIFAIDLCKAAHTHSLLMELPVANYKPGLSVLYYSKNTLGPL